MGAHPGETYLYYLLALLSLVSRLVYVPNEFIGRLIRTIERDPETRQKILYIQGRWKMWLCKQKVKRLRDELDVDLGMKMPEPLEDLHKEEEVKYTATENVWIERQEDLALVKEQDRIEFMEKESTTMAWELKYNVLQWMIEMRDLQGTFPVFPEEKDGGITAIFSNKTVAEVAEELEDLDDPKAKKGKTEKKKKKDGKDKGKKKKKDEDDEGWVIQRSEIMTHLTGVLKEYDDYWYLKDEMDNPDQAFDKQKVLEEVKENASQIIRKQVEDLMRLELERLKYAIDRERKPKPKKEKKKKEKKGKKKGADPTGGKSVEELYGELAIQGIVKPVEKRKFAEFLGEHNFLASTLGTGVPNPPDVRNFLTQLVALPMSSEFLHQNLPLFNSMLLAGPKGTGKTHLVHSLCSEIGATLFDISPRNLIGKYEGKKSEEYLWNVLLKVGKAMEPSVFLIDDCERLFPKTPPKGLDDKPTRWAKVWPKMMHKKKIKKGDRMFLMGVTSDPFATKPKPMFKLFKNVVYIPAPNYGSRKILWEHYLTNLPGCKITNVNTSIIAKLTNGYTGRDIENVVNSLPQKISHRKLKNLTNKSIIATLPTSNGPMFLEEMEEWSDWYEKTPLMKSRLSMLARLEEAAEEAASGKGAPKKKKK